MRTLTSNRIISLWTFIIKAETRLGRKSFSFTLLGVGYLSGNFPLPGAPAVCTGVYYKDAFIGQAPPPPASPSLFRRMTDSFQIWTATLLWFPGRRRVLWMPRSFWICIATWVKVISQGLWQCSLVEFLLTFPIKWILMWLWPFLAMPVVSANELENGRGHGWNSDMGWAFQSSMVGCPFLYSSILKLRKKTAPQKSKHANLLKYVYIVLGTLTKSTVAVRKGRFLSL